MITQTLVKHILSTLPSSIPPEVKQHAKRSMLNWLGVTIGAAFHPSVDMVIAVKEELQSADQVTLIGRADKADLLMATLINGMASHIFDYDDTHLDTIHHPSGPVAPVVFALGEKYGFSLEQIVHAFILGVETELRISNAVYPAHYDLGWHITSTAGVFGAAVAAGVLLELNEEQMIYALGLAGTQAFGLREMFGTMTKPFHPGKAAQNGLLAAMLAKRGFTSSKQVLEAKRGFANVLSPAHDLNKVTVRWGEQWELLKNAFKPYACGIVLHPSIDACIALRKLAAPEQVEKIELRVHPYVVELTGKQSPTTGLEGKFSVYHTAAIAFLEGDASEEQYADECVLSSRTSAFREKIRVVPDPSVEEDQAFAKLQLITGDVHQIEIAHATGSISNPMTDEGLLLKFTKLAAPILSEKTTNQLLDKWSQLKAGDTIDELLLLTKGKGKEK